MSNMSGSSAGPMPAVELSDAECRVLGALIEKEATTPDAYPMTTNAITTACNQKTNRDPVVSYTPVLIDSTLLDLRQRNLVRRVHTPGSRSTKHRQTLDEALRLDRGELALLSVLLLRGAQTVGELRLRTERQHSFDDLESAEACLRGLAGRSTPLVRQLERQPGHKEARWQHLLLDPDLVVEPATATAPSSSPDLQAAPPSPSTASSVAAPQAAPPSPSTPSSLAAPHAAPPSPAVASPSAVATAGLLEARVKTLEAEVERLRAQLSFLAEQLGESLE